MSSISFNGQQYDEDTFAQASSIVMNARRGISASTDSFERGEIIRRLGKQYNGERDIYEVLGYNKNPDEDDYRTKFERQDIANRVVTLPANDTWRHHPKITDDSDEETSFERHIKLLGDNAGLWDAMRRLDLVSGIGEYGVLFIGFQDGQDLEDPVNTSALNGPDDVSFYTPFAQDSVSSWRLGKDDKYEPSDPRYNLPVSYSINFGDIDDNESDDIHDVHWSRVIHVAEGKVESELKGTPRLKPIYNRLDDREKVLGASAEMFWTGANPKYQFDIKSDNAADIPESELDKMDDQVQKLVHEMQSYIKTFNTDIEQFGGEEVDPRGIMEEIDKSISGQTGIPTRILKGSEQAELASTQDRATWYGRVETRRNRFAEPEIIRPIIDRHVEFGIIDDPQGETYSVTWPNLFELNELEMAEAMETRANALNRAAPQGNTDMFGDPEAIMAFVMDGERPEIDDDMELPEDPMIDDE